MGKRSPPFEGSLKAGELREYVAPRRYALLLAAFRAARGRLLDELTAMLIKFSAKIVWRSKERLEETRIDRVDQSATLIATSVSVTSRCCAVRKPIPGAVVHIEH
jgi:hypothetical protein